jgi:hypothetical protein
VIVQAKVAVWFREQDGKEWIAVYEDFVGSMDIDQKLEPVGRRGGILYGRPHLRIDGNFSSSRMWRVGPDAPQPPLAPKALPG